MEYTKFDHRRAPFRNALAEMQSMGFTFEDFILHHPAFAGHMNMARFLALYETFRKTQGLAGHLAEVGVWKGAGMLYFAKLLQIFEPESAALVHGFDWYRGTVWGPDEMTDRVQSLIRKSRTSEEETRQRTDDEARELHSKVRRLIEIQDLENIVYLHNFDVRTGLGPFFESHPHIQFRIVFMDIGSYEATSACLPHFWPRLVPGGIMILDQFNHEMSPGETRAVRELLPDLAIHTFPFTNHPSAYIVKPAAGVPYVMGGLRE
ncbi:MAG: class I SAM-dependent methyltransferase [Alphaproteobacteria bacterium]